MNISIDKCTENTTTVIISCKVNNVEYSISLYYSYITLIAIKDTDNVYYVSENIYTNKKFIFIEKNTEKFLNTIEPNKDNRLRRDIFEKKAQAIIDNLIIFNPYN